MSEQSVQTDAAARGPTRPWWKRVTLGISALLLAILLLIAALWVWSGSEGSLATALRWWNQPALQTQQVTGNLRSGGRVAQLRWHDTQGHDIEAQDVALRWDWRALLDRRLHIHDLKARSLRLTWPHSDQPSAGPPESLALPLPVQVDALQIDQLSWAGPPALQAGGLRARYDFNGQRHALTLTQAELAQGRYSGHAELQAQKPLALSAKLQGELSTAVPGSSKTLPLQVALQASGPLADLQLSGQLSSTGERPAVLPSAQLQARLTPWAEQPVPEANAVFEQLNLALLWPQAPQTQLTGKAQVQPSKDKGWLISGQLQNARPGPWDQQRLPLQQADWRAEWRGGSVLLQSLNAQIGPGRVQAQGQWLGAADQGWEVLTRFEQLSPHALHSQWPMQSLQGKAKLQGSGQGLADGLGFEVQLQAPTVGDPRLNALQLMDAQARGRWRSLAGGSLDLQTLTVRTRQAQLNASGQYQVNAQAAQGQLRLQAPGLQVQGDGQWRPERGNGQAKLQGQDLAAAWRWLSTLPGLAEHLPPAPAAGRADLTLAWQGGWRDPTLQATLDVPTVDWPAAVAASAAKPGPVLQLRAVQARLDGRLSQARWSASGQMLQGKRRAQLSTAGEGGATWTSPPGKASALSWQASVQQLNASLQDPALGAGTWQLVTQRPFNLKGASLSGSPPWVELQAGQAQLGAPAKPGAGNTPALLDWQPSRWQAGQLRTSGTLKGLPLVWAELLAGPQMARAGVVGDLLFDGRWDVTWGERLKLDAELTRRSGDLSIHAETSAGLATRVAAGVREARLSLQGDASSVRATVRWDSERAGKVQGTLQVNPKGGASAASRWPWAEDTPLSGELQAQLPRIGAWSLLAPPGWRLRGSLATALRVGGTLGQPQLSGQLQADDLALRSVVDGVELGNGRLRGRLDGNRLLIDEFTLQGAGSSGGKNGGKVSASGEASLTNGQPQVQLKAELQQLRVSVRRDRQLTVSGDLQAALRGREGEITGVLRVDQARLELPNEERPQLDSDVVVRGGPQTVAAPATSQPSNSQKPKLSVAVRVDLGDDFRLQGKGVSTRLRGALAITDESLGTPRLFGTVNTVDGEYQAYGQRLNIERGVLRFTGPLDNPSLDVLAIRPNLSQRVGVQITGTALLPRVRLYADPELPDAEKLSWLVLGHSTASGGAEAALLQQAAIALFGNGKGGGGRNLASTFGLDELSFRTPSTQADGTASAGAVTFGKRFSSNFYAAYERSLSGTLGTLYMFYELSQRFKVRAQAGEQTAVDLIFTVPYE